MSLKYGEIIKQMSLEEKALMMSGKNTWETVDFEKYGIPSMAMSDGPHGLRRQAGAGDHLGLNASLPATCFPTAATIANSWDEKLGEEIGTALAEEAVTMDVNVILGPGLNIKRSPLCGRNFEYFSEDPYHAGKMAAAYVKGIQSKGISACPKHFAANSQELRRMASDSVVDERTFREIYTTGFEIAVKEGKSKSIMSSYNEVNGVYANENRHMLQEILVDEWGFDGYVVSDWGGSNDHALGVMNGSHLEMPGTGKSGMRDIVRAVKDGTLPEEVLDQRLDELLNVVFAGLDEISESEGLDRTHMHMPQAQNELIDAVTAVNTNVVVVLSAGSSIEMPWFDYVKGIVHGYLGGQAGASAMMNVLTGKVCPSGKLNETYPLHYEDTPAFHYYPSKERSSEYREALYVGYRYYTTVGKKVRFPFGYGLSYTTFAYSNFSVDKDGVTFTIKNTGDVEGTEIAQLYVGKQSETIFRPVRELKGFARVTLAPGEEKSVHIAFEDKTFRFYDTRTNTWEVESGNYQIMVGTDADTMVLEGSLEIAGTVADGGYSKEILPEYFSGKIENVDDIEYRELYGREIPDGSWSGEIQMNDAVCQLYYGKGIFGKLFYGVLRILLKISEWQGKPNLNVLFNYNMPIRGYAKMTGGFVTMEMARALTEMANGHRIKGTAHLIKAAVKRD